MKKDRLIDQFCVEFWEMEIAKNMVQVYYIDIIDKNIDPQEQLTSDGVMGHLQVGISK